MVHQVMVEGFTPGGTLLVLLDNSSYSLNEDQMHDQTRLQAMVRPQAQHLLTQTSFVGGSTASTPNCKLANNHKEGSLV